MAHTALAVLLGLLAGAAGWPCSPARRSDCAKAPAVSGKVPQFITITWDDAVDPTSYGIVQQIVGGLKQGKRGCPIPSTFFVTCADTVPAAVQALYLAGNEIASHTFNHVGNPGAQEIVGCRDWLAAQTGIPRARISGFRAPFLLHSTSVRQALAAAGFQYDSSLPDTAPSRVSPNVRQRTWPYRMDAGIPQACDTGSCSASERWPLWEIPLWAAADAAGRPIASMDPPGDALEIYKRELAWRLSGNRAPLGLFFHAGMESQRVEQLRQFIQYAAALPDVYFVTNQQLLAWMQKPVSSSAFAAQLTCVRPTDIAAGTPVCSTYVGDCMYGAWDSRKCRCVCIGEGARGGYCRNAKTGACTKLC